jgi:hypothetical protein
VLGQSTATGPADPSRPAPDAPGVPPVDQPLPDEPGLPAPGNGDLVPDRSPRSEPHVPMSGDTGKIPQGAVSPEMH